MVFNSKETKESLELHLKDLDKRIFTLGNVIMVKTFEADVHKLNVEYIWSEVQILKKKREFVKARLDNKLYTEIETGQVDPDSFKYSDTDSLKIDDV